MLNLKWKEIYNEAELYKAALKVYTKPLFNPQKGYVSSSDNQTFYDFALESKVNLRQLHKKLSQQDFTYRPAKVSTIKANQKTRHLFIYPWEEKIVDAVLYYLLTSNFNKVFSSKSYAYKPEGGGVDRCQGDISKYLKNNKRDVYIIKRDISNFFPSINHEILWEKINYFCNDPFLLNLLFQRVRFPFYTKRQKISFAEEGVPFGASIACFLSNLYLDEIDKAFEKIDIAYYRYADDFLIITKDREKAIEAIELFEYYKEKLKLKCKPSHYQNLLLSNDENSEDDFFTRVSNFNHLGLEFRADRSIGLDREKQRKILKLVKDSIRKHSNRYKSFSVKNRAKKLIDKTNIALTNGLKQIAIVDYYLKHVTDEKQIKAIDRYIAETVLAAATKKGYKKSNFRIIPYKELRKMGLISLLHRKRLIEHGYLESSFLRLRNEVRDNDFRKKQQRKREKIQYYKQKKAMEKVKNNVWKTNNGLNAKA